MRHNSSFLQNARAPRDLSKLRIGLGDEHIMEIARNPDKTYNLKVINKESGDVVEQ
jgi:hypothetical protein